MLKISKGKKKPFKPDLAPLIDVVFLLLIFYMLTFAISGQGLNVKLPEESSSISSEEFALSIQINGVRDIRVGGKLTTIEELSGVLKLENGPEEGRINDNPILIGDNNVELNKNV